MSRPSPVKKACGVAQGGVRVKDRKPSTRKSWNTMCNEEGKGKE